MNFKNKLKYVFLTVILTFTAFNINAKADNKVMYMECSYSQGDYIIVYMRDDPSGDSHSYRIFEKDDFGDVNVRTTPYKSYSYEITRWVKNSSEACKNKDCNNLDESNFYTVEEINSIINQGYCPETIYTNSNMFHPRKDNEAFVSGKTNNNASNIKRIKPNFVIERSNYGLDLYKAYTNKGTFVSIRKELNEDGQMIKEINDSKAAYSGQHLYMKSMKENCFAENPNEKCFDFFNVGNRAGFEGNVVLSTAGVPKYVDSWINKGYAKPLTKQIEYVEKINSNQKLVNACAEINSTKKYDFSNYSLDSILNDLDSMKSFFDSYYSEDSKYKLCSNNETTSNYISSLYDCTAKDYLGYKGFDDKTGDYVLAILLDNLEDEVKKRKLNVDGMRDVDSKLSDFYKCSANLIYTNDNFTESDKNKIKEIRDKYEDLSLKHDITIVVDCETLIGKELMEKIRGYINIVKIIIPILLIGFGIYDFGSAMLSGNDDKMNKAKKQFITRIIISILIFISPIFINLLLKLANLVWSNISPNSCGLF